LLIFKAPEQQFFLTIKTLDLLYHISGEVL